ncbi:DNA adenine methylase [Microvirga aerilata]|uniref:site-specific DNA-methyltransferase (adenine-specific) n=1 Tax=Microvirga aerilata TaxID=670292 RepID=A0A936ZIZ3_9HYPH|nr:DNA adenine methylase [Microvirga aerilata]MBL0406835.1 DNA adenine methylase [Microvirga aerilata]
MDEGTVAPLLAALAVLEHRFAGQGNNVNLGLWLAERRKSARLSQEHLCKLTGLTRPSVAQVERGRGNLQTLVAVMSVLKVRVSLRPNELTPSSTPIAARTTSPLRYPGGKSKALKSIAYHFPQHIDEYREPFAGGAAVAIFMSIRFPKASIWVNDLYQPLVSFWRVLRDPVRSREMVEVLKDLKERSATEDAARELFHRLRHEIDEPNVEELTQAIAFYVTNRCSFSGLTQSGSFSPEASEVRWTMQHIDRLAGYTPLMERWQITNLDYRDVLQEPWSGSAPILFMDPPYDIGGQGLYGNRGRAHTGFDHQTFRRSVEGGQAPTMVTYNASNTLRRMRTGWQQIAYDLNYSVRSNKRYRRTQNERRELILLNYVAPTI